MTNATPHPKHLSALADCWDAGRHDQVKTTILAANRADAVYMTAYLATVVKNPVAFADFMRPADWYAAKAI